MDSRLSEQQCRRAEELFHRLVDLPATQRSGALARECPDDAAVRHEVLALLNALAGSAAPAADAASDPHQFLKFELAEVLTSPHARPPAPGERLAGFRIVQLIAEGGMGSVYEAEQEHPRRRVALKLIRPTRLSAELLRRFDDEARLLGRLEHPGIARIYHAGSAETSAGPQPFFAMEFVEGHPLTVFAAANRLDRDGRLRLLIDVCDAVYHAHMRGVVHRDLKPGNIFVTPEGRAKVMDFGIARATDSDVRTTLDTQTGQVIGTLPYMSPEQAEGRVRDVDTRSDVYALGVVAYQLFTGQMPHALEGKTVLEAVRAICQDEPSRLGAWDRTLRGDVETVVGKALEKDRSRRYATAGELGADLRRILNYEPVTARPPSTWYQLRRFARRNRTFVLAVASVMVVLVAGVISTTRYALIARRERSEALRQQVEADRQRAQAQAINQFLTDDVLGGATPERLVDRATREVIVGAIVEPASRMASERFRDEPLLEAAVCEALARTLRSLGRYDLALPQARRALDLRRQLLGRDHPDTLSSMDTLGTVLQLGGDLGSAEPLYRDAVDLRRRILGADAPETLESTTNLAVLLEALGRIPESKALHQDVWSRRRRLFGAEDPRTMNSFNSMRYMLSRDELAEAEPILRAGLERDRSQLGPDHPHTLLSLNNLGYVMGRLERYAEAEAAYCEALERRRRVLGDDHLNTLISMNNLGALLLGVGRLSEADIYCQEALDRRRRTLGEDHPAALASAVLLAQLREAQGRPKDAEVLLRDALVRRDRVLGPVHPTSISTVHQLARSLESQGRLDEAELRYQEVFDRTLRARLPAAEQAAFVAQLGYFLARRGFHQRADEPLQRAWRILFDAQLTRSDSAHEVLVALAESAVKSNRSADAARWRAELTSAAGTTKPTTQPSLAAHD